MSRQKLFGLAMETLRKADELEECDRRELLTAIMAECSKRRDALDQARRFADVEALPEDHFAKLGAKMVAKLGFKAKETA